MLSHSDRRATLQSAKRDPPLHHAVQMWSNVGLDRFTGPFIHGNDAIRALAG
jgi:hypothetical protein